MDTEFGLDLARHTIFADRFSASQSPILCGIYMTPDMRTINVGLDRCDLALEDLSLIWLIADFASLYFRLGDWGKPTEPEYYQRLVSYGTRINIDLRFVVGVYCILLRLHCCFLLLLASPAHVETLYTHEAVNSRCLPLSPAVSRFL